MYQGNQSTDHHFENNFCTQTPNSILSSIYRISPDTSFHQQILQSLSRSDSLCTCDVKETPFGTHGPFATQLCTFSDTFRGHTRFPIKAASEHKLHGLDRYFDYIWLFNSFQTWFTATGFHFAPLEMLSTKRISQ